MFFPVFVHTLQFVLFVYLQSVRLWVLAKIGLQKVGHLQFPVHWFNNMILSVCIVLIYQHAVSRFGLAYCHAFSTSQTFSHPCCTNLCIALALGEAASWSFIRLVLGSFLPPSLCSWVKALVKAPNLCLCWWSRTFHKALWHSSPQQLPTRTAAADSPWWMRPKR